MKNQLLILGAMGVIGLMIVKSKFDTRGFGNNNPGNIRKSATPWDGKVEGSDSAFETFSGMEYGIRAIGKILSTYKVKYDITSISGVISRWAPPNENPTEQLIINASNRMNVPVNAPIDLSNPDVKLALTKAIIIQENGYNPFNDAFIQYSLAIA